MIFFRQLLLMLWKGGLMRKRHYIVTGFELLIPLLLTCLFVFIRSTAGPLKNYVPGESSSFHNFTSFKPKLLDPIRDENTRILFVPNKTEAENLVMTAFGKIATENSGYYSKEVTYFGFDSEKEMIAFYLKDNLDTGRSYSYYSFVFNNMDNGLPDHLDYKIRTQGYFQTKSKFNDFDMGNGPRTYNEQYDYSNFWKCQSAIDQAFIELKSAKTVGVEQYLQRFPYPEYISSGSKMSFVTMLPYIIVYGLIILVPVFVKRIIDEKVNRAKELMRMMGLNDMVYFSGVFLNTFIVLFIIGCVMTILFSINIKQDTAVFDYTDPSLFFVIITLYMVVALMFCITISTFFNKSVLGAIVSFIIWSVSHSVPTTLLDPFAQGGKYAQLGLGAKLATSLLPNCAIHWACKIMGMYEANREGSSWSNINQPGSPDDDLTIAMVLGMMLVSIPMYAFIIWYVDNVWPWQFGIPKHPAFLFMPSYWCPNKQEMKGSYSSTFNEYPVDKEYFEDVPEGTSEGISLKGISKIFGSGNSRKVAVDSVSLSMYHGQITVLLGHNGAGKTTTMNVLTGLYRPSSGTAIINGFDILTATKAARRSLGLCPQHNVLYDNLTVEEHLKFFAGLKGLTFAQMPDEVTFILQLLDLSDKRSTLSAALSGGMKRKLSLGIAIIGGSKVLVLDEPTSGMDPQARRAVWDLLQRIRSERTVLLTTHYMEEADVLGDRIAIMAEGKVQCAGSPLFLKRKFGAGYNLKFSKGDHFQTEKVTATIKGYVPDSLLATETAREASYILPTNDSEPFADMFDEIEQKKHDLDFNSFGLSITTMEDVFLKVGQLSEKALDDNLDKDGEGMPDNVENDARESIIISKPLVGTQLFLSRVKGLLLKRFHDTKRYFGFLLFQFLLPIVMSVLILLIITAIENAINDEQPPLKLDLGNVFGETKAFYFGDNKDFNDRYRDALIRTKASATEDPNPMVRVLIAGNSKITDYKQKYLVSGALNKMPIDGDYNLTAYYNGEPYHVGAMSLNIINNAFLRHVTGNNKLGITTTNHPLPSSSLRNQNFGGLFEIPVRLIYSCLFPSALSFLSASFVLFPIHENVTKSKLLQRMTGISGVTFWAMHFLWDFLVYIVAALALLATFAIGKPDIYGNNDGALGTLFFLLLLYGWSAIPFNYILSLRGKKPSSGFIFASSISSVAGLILTLAVTLYRIMSAKPDSADKLAFAFRLIPDFSVTYGATNIHVLGQKNSFCKKIDQVVLETLCPSLNNQPENYDILKCCPEQCGDNCFKFQPYFSWDAQAPGRDMLFLALTGFIYFGILILLETNFVRVWYSFKTNVWPRIYKGGKRVSDDTALIAPQFGRLIPEDSDVSEERSRIETLQESHQISSEALTVYNLTKNFSNLTAVDHLTFGLHKDECFGLLGVNGAGKTTTFSMLTGDLVLDDGNAYIGNYNVRDHLPQFRRSLGYCPQFDALLDRMTGREALFMFARLRGMPAADLEHSVQNIIEMVDLTPHADKIAETYSGGNRRKLSLALSLIGGPAVVFLDEPTAGVDPAARRKIWNTFTRVQNIGGMSFILTTHSMEECEALCARLAIMVNGKFRCLGSIQHLKSKFGQGYTLIVKLQKEQAFNPEHAEEVRKHLESTFSGLQLKDEHQGLLHYHLPDSSVWWSVIFREMERAKKIFHLEDYLVSDTTLEQIFLAFAKTQRVVAS